MRRGWTIPVLLGLGAAAGCGGQPTETGLNADAPTAKLDAIVAAAQAGDRQAVPQLVEQLQSDDPAVRLFAIQALERITDQRFGYNPFLPPTRRQEAVDRWVRAVAAGQFAEPKADGLEPGRD